MTLDLLWTLNYRRFLDHYFFLRFFLFNHLWYGFRETDHFLFFLFNADIITDHLVGRFSLRLNFEISTVHARSTAWLITWQYIIFIAAYSSYVKIASWIATFILQNDNPSSIILLLERWTYWWSKAIRYSLYRGLRLQFTVKELMIIINFVKVVTLFLIERWWIITK